MISTSGNTSPTSYELSAIEVLTTYESFLTGTADDVLLAVSFSPLDTAARYALERSATALGFGEGRLAYATIIDASGQSLTEAELLELIEGLDPLCLIVTDEVAAQLVGLAYEQPLDAKTRTVAGRRVAHFDDLGALLDNEAGKQQVWHALKQLPVR